MRVIILESTVFKVTEKQYNEIRKMEAEIHKNGYHPDNDLKVSEWLDEHRPTYKEVGIVDYEFRL